MAFRSPQATAHAALDKNKQSCTASHVKIILFTPSYFPHLCGMTYAAHSHAQQLAKLGADVWLVTGRKGDSSHYPSESGDYQVKTFDISGSGLPWNRIRGELAAVLDFARTLAPDLVIAEGWYTWGASILPHLRRHSRHCVISSHGAADKTIGDVKLSRIFRSLTYRYFEKFRSGKILDVLSAAMVLSSRIDNDRFADQRQFKKREIPTFVSPNFSNYSIAVSPRTLGPWQNNSSNRVGT